MGCLTYSRLLCLSREYIYILGLESAIGTDFEKSDWLLLADRWRDRDSWYNSRLPSLPQKESRNGFVQVLSVSGPQY
jgi:hypothetical protein